MDVRALLMRARRASNRLRGLPASRRDAALDAVAEALHARRGEILAANREDLAAASALPEALRDRLALDEARVDGMIRAVREVRAQADPLGAVRELGAGRSGIRVTKRRVPLGLIAIVFEARPNVGAECAALTLRSGNAVVLRGGKEALRSNVAVVTAVRAGIEHAGVDPDAVVLIEDPDRAAVEALLTATGLVDLVIPRGGAGLMAMVDAHARVPVIRHGQGVVHVYVDARADAAMAARITYNSKVDRPGVCNALETLLVHQSRVDDVLVPLARRLVDARVVLVGDERVRAACLAAGLPCEPAEATTWDTEFLALRLAVRAIDDLDEALEHIERHGTNHTAAIVTEDEAAARRFLETVDASCVLWNASTRFNDGGELGLGAEMGISTSKMHAYGPMSATELTAEKIVVYGEGQVRGGVA